MAAGTKQEQEKDLLTEMRERVETRLSELRPRKETLLNEVEQIDTEMRDLEFHVDPQAAIDKAKAEAKAEVKTTPAPTPPASNGGTRRGRRRSNGGRRGEFLQVVKDNPGITVAEAAGKMGIKANYLYRLKADALAEKEIREETRKLYVS